MAQVTRVALAFALALAGCREAPRTPAAPVAATPVVVAPERKPTRPIGMRFLRPHPLTGARAYTVDLAPTPLDDAWDLAISDPTDMDVVNAYLDEVDVLLAEVDMLLEVE